MAMGSGPDCFWCKHPAEQHCDSGGGVFGSSGPLICCFKYPNGDICKCRNYSDRIDPSILGSTRGV